MIQFYNVLMRPKLQHFASLRNLSRQDWQTGEYPGKQARMVKKLETCHEN